MTKHGSKALASGPEGKSSWGDRIRKGLQDIKDGIDQLGDSLGEALGPQPQPIPIPVNDGRQRPNRRPSGRPSGF